MCEATLDWQNLPLLQYLHFQNKADFYFLRVLLVMWFPVAVRWDAVCGAGFGEVGCSHVHVEAFDWPARKSVGNSDFNFGVTAVSCMTKLGYLHASWNKEAFHLIVLYLAHWHDTIIFYLPDVSNVHIHLNCLVLGLCDIKSIRYCFASYLGKLQ